VNFEIAPASTEIQANWDDAKFYCFFLSIDGKTGWRLPTKEELNEIYESVNDFEKAWYWSSTENNGNTAWDQNMSNGYQYGSSKADGSTYVRAVRDLKDK
jgi:formylglycine-generating enzyme required for sulfatase activity